MSKPQRCYLVTGAAGFIGARFVESCKARGIAVLSVDHEEFFTSRDEHQGLEFGKIIDRDRLLAELAEGKTKPDAIIHLGAISDTREANWDLLNRLNLNYTRELWNFATEEHIPFVYASSAATYGDGALGYDDDEKLFSRLKPLNAYGESKLKFDIWALEQERKGIHPPSWSGFRFFNVYGFGERHKGFMASVVLHAFDQIQKTGKVTLFKSHKAGIPDGYQKRDFIFVEDVIQVMHFALEKPIQRGVFNLGTGQARPFLDLVRSVFKALGKPEQIEFVDTPLSIRDKYQYFTEAKMERLRAQGYDLPFSSLEKGVEKYVRALHALEVAAT